MIRCLGRCGLPLETTVQSFGDGQQITSMEAAVRGTTAPGRCNETGLCRVREYKVNQVIRYCVFLWCGVWTAAGQTNVPVRPTQPTRFVTKIGECESRIGGVEVVVSGVVEPGKATIRIECHLNHVETACDVDPTNALAVARLIESVSTDLRNGKQSAGQYQNVEVSAFELKDKKFVEVMFHQGDASAEESGCRLWLDSYNALSLSHLILSGKTVADWLEPRLSVLE